MTRGFHPKWTLKQDSIWSERVKTTLFLENGYFLIPICDSRPFFVCVSVVLDVYKLQTWVTSWALGPQPCIKYSNNETTSNNVWCFLVQNIDCIFQPIVVVIRLNLLISVLYCTNLLQTCSSCHHQYQLLVQWQPHLLSSTHQEDVDFPLLIPGSTSLSDLHSQWPGSWSV